ncbi:MAG: site-specific integrase [Erysipelotrichaceae bacterium]|nr:site-specific integrase [Erysipelotrichaceae bacterium]
MLKESKSRKVNLKPGESVRNRNGKELYFYRWSDLNGKRHSISSIDLDKLREKEKEIIDKKEKTINQSRAITVNQIFDMCIHISNNIPDNCKYMYMTFVYPSFGMRKISCISSKDIRMFYVSLTKYRSLRIEDMELIHDVLFQIFDLAYEQSYIRRNVVQNSLIELKIIRDKSNMVEFLNNDQQRLFEEILFDNRYKHFSAIYLTMMHAGLTMGEATGLRWCDIDFDKKEIDVNHSLICRPGTNGSGYQYTIKDPKTEIGFRRMPMTKQLYESFLYLKEYQESGKIVCKKSIDGYSGFAFINKSGTVYNYDALNDVLERVHRDCNIKQIEKSKSSTFSDVTFLPWFTCKALRRTYALRLSQSGADLKTVSYMLGNKDIYTTEKWYADVLLTK